MPNSGPEGKQGAASRAGGCCTKKNRSALGFPDRGDPTMSWRDLYL